MPNRGARLEERLRLFIESVRDYAFVLMDAENRVTEWNIGAQRMFGYTERESLGRSAALFFVPEDRQAGEPEKELRTAAQTDRAEGERWHVRKDGNRFPASGVMTAMRDHADNLAGFAKVMRDVTEREEVREKLASLREKTVLFREIRHRVKNNLQVIVSLISLQTSHVTGPKVISMFEEPQNRGYVPFRASTRASTAQRISPRCISASTLQQLAEQLAAFYGIDDRIDLQVREQAMPLALVSNELLCNAFKHAFVDEAHGRVLVGLRYVSDGRGLAGELEVSDNGRGLPEGIDIDDASSMGFHLVSILTRQLHASTEIERENGTSIRVRFPIPDD